MRSKGKPKIASEEPQDSSIFFPQPCLHNDSSVPLSGDDWKGMLWSKCTFSSEIFSSVMLNLIKNPNIMSSHLFRADVLYDSQSDASTLQNGRSDVFTKHMKREYQPIHADIPGFEWQRTFVRQLVPRNRQLDNDLVQSCHTYSRQGDLSIDELVLYIPHVSSADEMPWYHPQVSRVAFLYSQLPQDGEDRPSSTISLHFFLFPDHPTTERLERTALQLLRTIHKHGQGQSKGYVKRVHHDQVVPQQRFQDTYARLKIKYAKQLIGDWVEQTDPTKHVFEDLGIAAFLIELWADMYDTRDIQPSSHSDNESRPRFPGFVDIGCGNGVLVNILLQEGYTGWGFDARRRKTWDTFPANVQSCVREMVLVPQVLFSPTTHDECESGTPKDVNETRNVNLNRHIHNGVFPSGTFIVSNHADELTAWTPLLGYLNASPFIAIPCCSHDLAGSRFRAPAHTRLQAASSKEERKVQAGTQQQSHSLGNEPPRGIDGDLVRAQAAETGSLKKPAGGQQVQSAYATLCSYVASLAEEVGYSSEKEMLRIPSTRNACVVGRRWAEVEGSDSEDRLDEVVNGTKSLDLEGNGQEGDCDGRVGRETVVRTLVERELGMSLDSIREDWVKRAKMILGKKGEGH